MLKRLTVELSQADGTSCHGFSVDRITDPLIPPWYVEKLYCLTLSNQAMIPGGIPPYIYKDIGGTDRWIWFVLANLLALAATAPFVGALSDLLGRRYVAITGAALIVLGMIVCSTAHTMNIFIGRLLPLWLLLSVNFTLLIHRKLAWLLQVPELALMN